MVDTRTSRLASIILVVAVSLTVVTSSGCGWAAEPVADAEVLVTSDVIEVSGFDDVSLVDLTANPNAPYQAAFERTDGSRVAIITIEDASEYEDIIEDVEGRSVDIGDEGIAAGGAVYFRKGDRAVTIYTVTVVTDDGTGGALSSAQVLELAEIAAEKL